ncbi:hypothetical protein G3N55_12085 [Dissulfurirhabdus thermomarina]|uniref:DUF5714 domain-containing protein n=1 Tax=Dissulfurirhabdus thermomarina TaxID=1765737 RepID=A0A6N9TTZ8_DISTH|nr:DUF5714 domain-containing protein [Dissulfurirhabdus thermomarina]NDY43573.1 hypothetical protein [Dissulfurirhabdus thermomarina]NMX23000.1 hypothetical protein [Dissulfurirhabdus thermomarina]
MTCTSCGRSFMGAIRCPGGHFVCDDCHDRAAIELATARYRADPSPDPVRLFQVVTDDPAVPMLGCHHAAIAALALVTALNTEGTVVIPPAAEAEILERVRRQAIGGYCGLTGVCGVIPAVGACFATLLGSKCGTRERQRRTMAVTAAAAAAVAGLTGPSCCKAYALKCIEVACRFLHAYFGVALPIPRTPACGHAERHPHGCRRGACPYYPASRDTPPLTPPP